MSVDFVSSVEARRGGSRGAAWLRILCACPQLVYALGGASGADYEDPVASGSSVPACPTLISAQPSLNRSSKTLDGVERRPAYGLVAEYFSENEIHWF